ncbi:MAG: T9SS type A sorting domain-containing protein [Chitinophagaceae bacterium]|nr:T9SS type A sorting domain-containing protein [Chitinophagaceae bacterium]
MKIFTLSAFLLVAIVSSSFSNSITASPFGVVLKSFNATTDGKVTHVSWDFGDMEQEVTCLLERSEDGSAFSAVESFLVKQGFSGVMNFTDKKVAPGQFYYRLHVVKLGFIPFRSHVVSIRITKENDENVATEYRVVNPFREQVTINGKFKTGLLKVEVSGMDGRVRFRKTIQSIPNSESITFAAENLVKGTYIVRVSELKGDKSSLIMTKCIIKNAE